MVVSIKRNIKLLPRMLLAQNVIWGEGRMRWETKVCRMGKGERQVGKFLYNNVEGYNSESRKCKGEWVEAG